MIVVLKILILLLCCKENDNIEIKKLIKEALEVIKKIKMRRDHLL